MHKILFYILLVISSNLSAQPNWEWQKRIGEKLNVQRLSQLILNLEGDIVAIGTTRTGGVYFGIFEPTTGGLLSEKVINSKNTIARSILQTRDGNYIVVGETTAKAAWLAKLDASGVLIWEEFYGGAEARSFANVVQDTEGGFYLAGFSGRSLRVFKISRRGLKLWETDFPKEGKMEATDLAWTKNGRLVVVGFEKFGNNKYRGIIKTLDVDGHILTERSYENTYFSDVSIATNGDWLISGASLARYAHFLFLRINTEGVELKRSVSEQKSPSVAYVLAHRNNETTFLAGTGPNKNGVKNDLVVMALDAEDKAIWPQLLTLGSNTNGKTNGIVQTPRMVVVGGEVGNMAVLAGFSTTTKIVSPPVPSRSDMLSVVWTKPDVELEGNNFITLQSEYPMTVKALSSKPLSDNDFKILINQNALAKGAKFDNVKLDSSRNGQTFIYTFSAKIPLSIGENALQIEVRNGAGKEKTKKIKVNYNPRQSMNLHILSIGVPFPNLNYTKNDAADVVKTMDIQGRKLFKNVYPKLLNSEAQTEKVRIVEALEDLKARYSGGEISAQDVLILSISSHGFTSNNDHTRFRIAAAQYSEKNEQSRSLDFETEILNILNYIRCKKIILIDACHSGAAENPILNPSGGRGLFFDNLNGAIDRLMKIEEGTWCIVSSSAEEKSWEDIEWQNGAFTKAFGEAARNERCETQGGVWITADTNGDGYVTLNELFEFVKMRVTFLVWQKKKKTQTPRLISPRKTADFPLFYIR